MDNNKTEKATFFDGFMQGLKISAIIAIITFLLLRFLL